MQMKVTFDSKGDFENLSRWLDNATNTHASQSLSEIAKEGGRRLTASTPKATGETARGWTAEVVSKGDISEIAWMNNAHPELKVNMALLIEQGHGTGTGGYVPPKPYIKGAMDSVWKTAGDKIAKELIK